MDVFESSVHTVNLELHSKFSNTVPVEDFVLFIVKVNGGEGSSFISTIDSEEESMEEEKDVPCPSRYPEIF